MDFFSKYLHFSFGLMVLLGSIVRLIWLKFYKLKDCEDFNSSEEFPREVEVMIILGGSITAGLSLREAYVIFNGLS